MIERLRRCVATSSGQLVPLKHLINMPRSFVSAVKRKMTGRFYEVPFIPYCATQALDAHIERDSVVVEVGAGNSTIWLAKRSEHVSSMEWDRKWLGFVRDRLADLHLSIDLRQMHAHEEVHFDWIEDKSVDLIIVDGGPRPECFRNLWKKLRPGGLCYLDNWDNPVFWTEGFDAYAEVERMKPEFETIETMVDFIPGMLSVETGLLIRRRA